MIPVLRTKFTKRAKNMRTKEAVLRPRWKTMSFCFRAKRVRGFPDKRRNRLAIFHASLHALAAIRVHVFSGLSAAAAEIVAVAGVLIVAEIVGVTGGAGGDGSSAGRAGVAAINKTAATMGVPDTDIPVVLSSFPKC